MIYMASELWEFEVIVLLEYLNSLQRTTLHILEIAYQTINIRVCNVRIFFITYNSTEVLFEPTFMCPQKCVMSRVLHSHNHLSQSISHRTISIFQSQSYSHTPISTFGSDYRRYKD